MRQIKSISIIIGIILLTCIVISVVIKFESSTVQASISVISLIAIVVIYGLSAWDQFKERKTRGREKILRTLLYHYIGRFNKIKVKMGCDFLELLWVPDDAEIWFFLDSMYSSKKELFHRDLFNYFLSQSKYDLYSKNAIAAKPLFDFREMDKKIRQYYGMNDPMILRDDFPIEDALKGQTEKIKEQMINFQL